MLSYRFSSPDSPTRVEIGMDEAGRGPLFGRLYTAAVVLPSDPSSFDGSDIKDSKKFSSKAKMKRVADYIKEHCLAYHVDYVESNVIDEINILQAVYRSMHTCVREILSRLPAESTADVLLVVDGNSFSPYCVYDDQTETIKQIPHETVEQGDAKYMGIAAASILAKVAHDEYIYEMCETYPLLQERYDLMKNVGYGTKKHLDGIREHGISEFHRKSFGLCKTAKVSKVGP